MICDTCRKDAGEAPKMLYNVPVCPDCYIMFHPAINEAADEILFSNSYRFAPSAMESEYIRNVHGGYNYNSHLKG